MNGVIRKLALITTTYVVAVGLSGCATTAKSIESSAELAAASAGEHVAFGKFRLVRNGYETKLGKGIFANSAVLYLYQTGDSDEIIGKVGMGGEFAWSLQPGSYQVSSIDFNNRGEKISLNTDFKFAVSADHPASYLGTMTLETTLDNGYYGVNGTVDRYTVTDDCAKECSRRLSQLGLSMEDATVALMQEQSQLARTR